MFHTNSGSRDHVTPRARSVCTVTMKLIPVRIEDTPSTNTPSTTQPTAPRVLVLYGA
jgi:hypothetical protein